MTQDRVYGHTRSGKPITDKEIEALAAEAEAGYDVDTLLVRRAKRGRPTLGSAPASVESVRLDPERERLGERRPSLSMTLPPGRSPCGHWRLACLRRDNAP